MFKITTGEKLELHHLITFRGNAEQCELETISKDIEEKIEFFGAKKVSNPIVATYNVDGAVMDIELLIPIDREIDNIGNYIYKEKIMIVNAAKLSYKGNPSGLQDACNELNQYMEKNGLQPITVGYNITKHVDFINIDNSEIEIYVGINPNVL